MSLRLTSCPDDTCRMPAEVIDEYLQESTAGPVRVTVTFCVMRHRYTIAG